MADEQEPEDNSMEELTVSEAAKEFRIKRGTLNNWIWQGKIPARKAFGELGIEYYLVKRGEIANFLQNRHNFGRPLKRT